MPSILARCILHLFYSMAAVDLPSPGDIPRVPTHSLNTEVSFTTVLDVDLVMPESSFCTTLYVLHCSEKNVQVLYSMANFVMGPAVTP